MTIAIILIVLWALGLVTGSTLGGFVHILLVIAIIVVLVRLIQGRRILRSGKQFASAWRRPDDGYLTGGSG